MAHDDDIASKFAQLNIEKATGADDRKERTRKFSDFHASVFKNIEEWVAALADSGVAVKDKAKRSVIASEINDEFSSYSLVLAQKHLHSLRVEAVAFNRINFHDVADRAVLVLTTRGSDDAPVHDLAVFLATPESRVLEKRPLTSASLKKGLDWSKKSFDILLGEWMNAAKK